MKKFLREIFNELRPISKQAILLLSVVCIFTPLYFLFDWLKVKLPSMEPMMDVLKGIDFIIIVGFLILFGVKALYLASLALSIFPKRILIKWERRALMEALELEKAKLLLLKARSNRADEERNALELEAQVAKQKSIESLKNEAREFELKQNIVISDKKTLDLIQSLQKILQGSSEASTDDKPDFVVSKAVEYYSKRGEKGFDQDGNPVVLKPGER